ncbi:hypothetical protein BH10PSE19_BH10PSE19_17380 [soil metagenome]
MRVVKWLVLLGLGVLSMNAFAYGLSVIHPVDSSSLEQAKNTFNNTYSIDEVFAGKKTSASEETMQGKNYKRSFLKLPCVTAYEDRKVLLITYTNNRTHSTCSCKTSCKYVGRGTAQISTEIIRGDGCALLSDTQLRLQP